MMSSTDFEAILRTLIQELRGGNPPDNWESRFNRLIREVQRQLRLCRAIERGALPRRRRHPNQLHPPNMETIARQLMKLEHTLRDTRFYFSQNPFLDDLDDPTEGDDS